MSNHSRKFYLKLGNSPVLHHMSKLAESFRKLGNSPVIPNDCISNFPLSN